ncbi:MAG TPA: hypothetical protein VGL77_00370 [Armatimonadota bacterium]|jgi:hypothetical protein
MGLIGFVAMLVLSVMYFSELGFRKVLLFNAIYFGVFFLPAFGIPSWVAVSAQFITLGSMFIAARSA